jgi:hypothetical protein
VWSAIEIASSVGAVCKLEWVNRVSGIMVLM